MAAFIPLSENVNISIVCVDIYWLPLFIQLEILLLTGMILVSTETWTMLDIVL